MSHVLQRNSTGHTLPDGFSCFRENPRITHSLVSFSFPCIARVALMFCLWKVGPHITGGLRKHVWKLYFLFLLFTLWILCINKDYPRHNSFEYETNLLSFVYVKKKYQKHILMWYKESLIYMINNEAQR